MAIRKRTTKTKAVATKKTISNNGMLWFFLFLVGIVVAGLTLIWQQLPTRPSYFAVQQPVQKSPYLEQRNSCMRAGGKWTDCGSPCLDQEGDSCAKVCEPQCLCGGTPRYSCPANTVCSTKNAEPAIEDIGVCRSANAVQEKTPKAPIAEIKASIDASQYPFIATGTVMNASRSIWWTAYDASETIVGNGVISLEKTSTSSSFEQTLFLSSMPTSTSLRFFFTAGSPEDRIEIGITSAPLVAMTRTIYKGDLESDQCEAILKEEVKIPKTIYPYEATMRAALGDTLIDLSVVQGKATIVVPNPAIYSANCAGTRIRAIAEAITKDFSSVSDLVIQEQNVQTQP